MRSIFKYLVFLLLNLFALSCGSDKVLLERDYTQILQDGPDRYNQLEGLSKAKAHYIDGLTMQQKGQHGNAVIDFRLALEADSAAAILYSLGESYKRLNRQGLAASAYQKAIELDPEYVLPLESLAELLMFKGEMQEAIKLAELAYQIEPNIQRKYMIASIYEYTDKTKAVQLYRELIEDEESGPFIVSKLLSLYKELDMEDDYLETIQTLYSKNKGNITYAQDMLQHYFVNEQYKEGNEFLESISDDFKQEDLVELYIVYGDNLYRTEIDSSLNAETEFIELIESQHDQVWRLDYLGGLLSGKINDIDKAEYFFDKVLTGNDTVSDLPLQVGLFFIDKDRDNKALEIFSRYSEKFPEDERFLFFSGVIYSERNELEKAEEVLLNAHRLDSTNVEVLTNLGLVYDKRGDSEKTVTFYERAYGIDPDNPLLNNNFAYHLAVNGGDLDRAERMSRYALSRDPENISYLDTYGWIHYKLGNYNVALENLEKAVNIGSPSAEVLEHLGDVYAAMEENDKALLYYHQSLALDPNRKGLEDKIININ